MGFFGPRLPVRRHGAAALDLAYVAFGRLDGFWERALQPWDIAAGMILVREAGGFIGSIGEIRDFTDPLSSGYILAGSPEGYPQLKRLLKAAA